MLYSRTHMATVGVKGLMIAGSHRHCATGLAVRSKSSPRPMCLDAIAVRSSVERDRHLLSPWLDHPYLPHCKSPTALLDMHHLTCGISSLLHSVNLVLFNLLLVHLILHISPHHSHNLRSHHLHVSLPRPFTPDLKLISFTNPFLHSHSYSFRTAFADLGPVLN